MFLLMLALFRILKIAGKVVLVNYSKDCKLDGKKSLDENYYLGVESEISNCLLKLFVGDV